MLDLSSPTFVVSLAAFALVAVVFLVSALRPFGVAPAPREIPASSWAWAIFFWLVILGIGVYERLGLVRVSLPVWIGANVCLALFAMAELWRDEFRSRAGEYRGAGVIELGILLLASYLTFVAIELPSNPYIMEFYVNGMVAEVVFVLVTMSVAHLLFLRTGYGAALAALVLFGFGMAEYFVVTFKDTPIMASDIFAIGTAAAVSGDYVYMLNERCIYGIALISLVLFLLSLIPKPKELKAARVVACLVGALALGGAGVFTLTHVSFRNDLKIYVSGWQPLWSYWHQGFISAFISGFQELEPARPDGYTKDAANQSIAQRAQDYETARALDLPAASGGAGAGASAVQNTGELTAAQEQFAATKPTVIVVMNETFADLSIYENLHAGYEGPVRFFARDNAPMRGRLQVSPYGGGTCNSEYEFLTSCSMGYLSLSAYPFMVYKLDGVENVASQFKELGYETIAMHPNRGSNWNRDVVYPDLGFDRFLDIFDFNGARRLRGKVSDEATYDKILELLEEGGDTPQFIFDVTMQNHSAYDTGLLPEEMVKHYLPDGEPDSSLDEYLALMEESDRALDAFLDSLEQMDRPIAVIFFGDHQPNITRQYNNSIFADEEQDLAHEQRSRETVYMLWTNYELAGWDGTTSTEMFSCNYLAPATLERLGVPLTEFQKAQLDISQDIPLINRMGYMDANGIWHELEDVTPAMQEMWSQHYYQIFGNGVRYQIGAGAEGRV